MASSTVEDYLKAILLAEARREDGRVPTGGLAAALGVTPGSVTGMLKTLADSGLVDYEAYAGAALTPAGRQLALHVVRRHRLVELFLVRVLGLDWSEVHEEAERLEHAVSERVIEAIDELLGRPEADPHGDPIPPAAGAFAPASLPALAEVPAGERARVARVADQDPEFLKLVERLGLRPGTRVRMLAADPDAGAFELELEGDRRRRAVLGLGAAAKIFVEEG